MSNESNGEPENQSFSFKKFFSFFPINKNKESFFDHQEVQSWNLVKYEWSYCIFTETV